VLPKLPAAKADLPPSDAMAIANLRALFQERGDLGDAETWWRRGADTGHRDAMSNLEIPSQKRGESSEPRPGGMGRPSPYRCARCGTPSDLVEYAWEALGDGSSALCLACLTGGEHKALDEEDG
jgi:hypothetical protein